MKCEIEKSSLFFNGYQVFYRGKFKDLYRTKDGKYYVRYKRAYREIDITVHDNIRQRLIY